MYTDILTRLSKKKSLPLDISVVEAPPTNRGIPSPSPSIAKEFVFERQKTEPLLMEEEKTPDTEMEIVQLKE